MDVAEPLDDQRESKIALGFAVLVLTVLTIVKPLGAIPVVGTAGFTIAAILQLYLPLRRMDAWQRDYDAIGLHFKTWRQDAKNVLWLMLLTFPPYIVGHHWFRMHAFDWALAHGFETLAMYCPRPSVALMAEGSQWVPAFSWPQTWSAWLAGGWWLLKITATHVLGVALPEETFYRGYLQPCLQKRWKPTWTVAGVPMGKAVLVASALFALGHFLGEWNPLRLGPFLPSLLFAWQRNATGSIMGAIAFHASCNVLGEILFTLYEAS